MNSPEIQEVISRLRRKAGVQTQELVDDVREDPNFFLNEGGADGTFGHAQFHDMFGEYMPEIAQLAELFGGKV